MFDTPQGITDFFSVVDIYKFNILIGPKYKRLSDVSKFHNSYNIKNSQTRKKVGCIEAALMRTKVFPFDYIKMLNGFKTFPAKKSNHLKTKIKCKRT